MNSIRLHELNRVFLAIRHYYYNQQRSIVEICDFDLLAQVANVSIEELRIYLERLQELNLIRYSMTDDKYVFLTSYGGNVTDLINI